MADHGSAAKPAPAIDSDGKPFGLVAYAGAIGSLVICYTHKIALAVAPMLGIAVPEAEPGHRPEMLVIINPHVQAVIMVLLVLVAVVGLTRDRRQHGGLLPLALGSIALVIIVGTLYVYYDASILLLGYIILLSAALLNHYVMLGKLNRTVAAQAREVSNLNNELTEFNRTLQQRVDDQVEEIQRLARLKRFLPTQVARLITAEDKESALQSHRRYIACLFCDIRGFTSLSEAIEPEEVMDVLKAYHGRLGQLLEARGGTIGHLAGDGLMVFFNDPIPIEQPVLEAVTLATEMRSAFWGTQG